MKQRKLLLDFDLDEQPDIKVNTEYARRFEHNKRREELHRLQDKHPELAARLATEAAAEAAKAARDSAAADARGSEDEEDEDSSSDDDDEVDDVDDDTDKVLETLVRIKRKDPVLKQPDLVLFPQEDSTGDHGAQDQQAAAVKGHKKTKPMYLRNVLAQQALEGGTAGSDDEEGSDDAAGADEGIPRHPVAQSYAAEQQELKRAFLEAAAEAEADNVQDGGVLSKKAPKRSATEADLEGSQDKGQQVNKLLDAYFGKDDNLDPAGAFLKSYLAKKAWKQPTDDRSGSNKKRLRGLDGSSSSSEDAAQSSSDGEDSEAGAEQHLDVDDEEDEEFLEEVDKFEAAYNFRFEEPGANRIQSFPRVIADSVRRSDERRKRQRDAKAARKQAEKEAREVEVRRLKNLKKQEIQDMFTRIQEEAGVKVKAGKADAGAGAKDRATGGLTSLLDELLEGDFDPEAYDKRMAAAFDDDYYQGADEEDELFGDREEELADESDVLKPAAVAALGSEAAAAGGFAALYNQLQQQQGEGDEAPAGIADDSDDANGQDEDKAAAAAARAEKRSQLQRKLEEYYKLDCEDNIAGIPCRFKYRQVPAENFGLSVEDILTLPDKELNQVVGMKKLAAPYREEGKRLRPNYKALQRIKGEAAAAATKRHLKRDKYKEQKLARQQRREQQQQQERDGGSHQGGQGKQQQQQRQTGSKRSFSQTHNKQHGWQQPRRQPQQGRQDGLKPVTEMSAEEKQAARMASYAKLTLKPQQQDKQQVEQPQSKHSGHHKTGSGEASKKGSKHSQPQQQGRLAAVLIDKALTKAQKKNLIRSLKRKEKQDV